ncbi:MAG: DUF4468 domain-containing protein [Bacteroidaceae bacterium]|nr:DUF4468 domain-containing protein [Bacteroidaceae bacterium]
MKKTIFTSLLLAFAFVAYAQEGTFTNGIYELKKVVSADTVKASRLYITALEVLSDWAGSNSKSKLGIDVQDKDEGLVVYKGNVHLGFEYYSKFAGGGFDVYVDMTIKVKCKDSKIQVTATVPSLTFISNLQHSVVEVPLNEIVPTFAYKGQYRIKKPSLTFGPEVIPTTDSIINMLCEKITKSAVDDF